MIPGELERLPGATRAGAFGFAKSVCNVVRGSSTLEITRNTMGGQEKSKEAKEMGAMINVMAEGARV